MYAIYIFGAMFMRIAWRMRLLYPEKLCSTPKGSQLKRKSSSSFVYSNEVLCACIIVGGLCSKYRLFFFCCSSALFGLYRAHMERREPRATVKWCIQIRQWILQRRFFFVPNLKHLKFMYFYKFSTPNHFHVNTRDYYYRNTKWRINWSDSVDENK